MFPVESVRDVLDYVLNNQHSDFYRRKFSGEGIKSPGDVKTYEDFQRLPFLRREEIAEDPWKLLHVDARDIDYIRSSTGTTQKGYVTVFYRYFSRKLPTLTEEAGVSRLLILTVVENLGFYLNQMRNARMTFTLGDIYNFPKSAIRASLAGVDGIETSPSIALMFSEHLKKVYDTGKIKALSLGGEILTQNLKARLREAYPNTSFYNIYGSAEAALLGWQCRRLGEKHRSVFHTYPEQIFYEVIDKKGEPCRTGETGELTVTYLDRMATPIIRYRTGDLARFHENKCECGEGGNLVEILGRSEHDFIRLGQGVELDWMGVDDAVFSMKGLVSDAQLRVNETERKGKLMPAISIDLVLDDKAGGTESEKARIGQEFMEKLMCRTIYHMKSLAPAISFRKASEMGLFEGEVNFVESIDKKGHKASLLIDQRPR